MRHLVFEDTGRYSWRDTPDPRILDPRQALVRPLVVACCDLDVGVVQGALPMPPGHAVGHEGIAEVTAVGDEVHTVRVGDRVVVPFQINCGHCVHCRRAITGSCAALPLMAMYGMAPLAGLDGGGFLADAVLVPFADAMLVSLPASLDPIAVASLSDNVPDGWRCVGPYRDELAVLDPADRRVLVMGQLSIGLYAAALAVGLGAIVDYVDTDSARLAAAENLGAHVYDRIDPDRSWTPYPIAVHTTADPKLLAKTLRATWPQGVCTDTGIYFARAIEMPLLPMYARADIPDILQLLETGVDLSPVTQRVIAWDDAPQAWPEMTGKTIFTRL